ncbi:MAG: carbamoyltransferase HypF [Oceanospirillaceae bacterium]|nr:carbamoyltransferase HypF [Oceanospirillaceae bacterium]
MQSRMDTVTSLKPPIDLAPSENRVIAKQIELAGTVQGVGFRPFVYRVADRLGLTGWVKNLFGHVVIHVEGDMERVQTFKDTLINQPPPNAIPLLLTEKPIRASGALDFHILASDPESTGEVSIPLDRYLCNACELELSAPDNYRFHYPFIACSDCGPRYSMLNRLPYDRPNTTMADFELCPVCNEEYGSPLDRRLHAQPIACTSCGPNLELATNYKLTLDTNNASIIDRVVQRLGKGDIIALKSVGGYHLICDAANDSAVSRLRERKQRPDKPFAVMFPSLSATHHESLLDRCVVLSDLERRTLMSDSRPIVLLKRRPSDSISKYVAPNLNRLGVMLPCSPLHHLILEKFCSPIVATSGNGVGDPIVTTRDEAHLKLHAIADLFVHHNRAIARPIDDSVVTQVANHITTVRIGRGHGPIELRLPFHIDEPILGVGAHQKNTISLAWGNRLVVSPHIGDMDSPATIERFENTINDLQQLYGVSPKRIVCDLHPGYASTRWASKQNLPCFSVQHHHAHASAWALDAGVNDDSLVFVWDGVGLGEDNSLWGGEVFWGKPGSWKRIVTFSPLNVQGGNRVAKQPWRSAAAMSWQTDISWPQIRECDPNGYVAAAWAQDLNCHQTSSVGRLFDASAAISLNLFNTTYEAQGPITFEGLVEHMRVSEKCVIKRNGNASWIVDWHPLTPMLFDEKITAQVKAERFHAALVNVVLDIVNIVRTQLTFSQIGLSGGVFQNRILVEGIEKELSEQSELIVPPKQLPVNDAAISAGQIVEYAYRRLV